MGTIDHLTSNLADNTELYEMSKADEDVDALAAAISAALDDPDEAERLALVDVEGDVVHRLDEGLLLLAEGEVYLAMAINGREIQCSWSVNGEKYQNIGAVYDTSRFSDEYSGYGEFTGASVPLDEYGFDQF